MEWFDELLIPYASGAGLPVDQFKFVIFILLSYPLGFLHLNVLFRHLFATIIGFTFLVLSFGFVGIFHFLLSSFLVYGLVLLLGHSKAPTIGFVVMMGYLSYLHISRLFVDYMGWKMDVTAVVMVSTIKITSLCCNYADGYLADNLVSKNAKPLAIKHWPSILEYLSFLCYFPTFLAGPAFSYKSYLSYIDGTMYGKEKPSTASEVIASLKVMLVAFGCVGTHLFLGSVYPMDVFFVETSPLDGTSLLYKIYYLHLALMVKRCQYYFVWKLSEGAAILAGMGFNGYETDKKTGERTAKFDGCCNIDILKCELPQNVRDYTTFWNMKTAEWLRIYVYDRMQDPKSNAPSGYAMLVTNTISAFWHGFYPGYYLAFGYASFIIEEMRMCRSSIRPYFMKPRKVDADGKPLPEEGNFPLKYLYDAFGVVCTWLTFDAGMGFFTALSMANSWTYMNRVYWIQLILSAVAYPILVFLSARNKPAKKVDDKAKTEADKTKKTA